MKKIVLLLFILIATGFAVCLLSPSSRATIGGIEPVLAQAHSVGQVNDDMALKKVVVNNAKSDESIQIVALTGTLKSGEEAEFVWIVEDAVSPSTLLYLADLEKLKSANNLMVNCGESWATASKIPRMKTIERNEEKATLLAAHVFKRCLA